MYTPRLENKITLGVIIATLTILVVLLTAIWNLSSKMQQYNDVYEQLLIHSKIVDDKLNTDEVLLMKLNTKLDIIQYTLKLNLGDPKK